MARQFDLAVERDSEGYFVASVPAFLGSRTQAKLLDDLMSRVRRAIEHCHEVRGKPVESLDIFGAQHVTAEA